MSKSTRSTFSTDEAAAPRSRHRSSAAELNPALAASANGDGRRAGFNSMVRVDFACFSEIDPSISIVIHALAEVNRAIADATMDLNSNIEHVNGLAVAASILADQLSGRVFSEHREFKIEPAIGDTGPALATGGTNHA